MDAGASGVHTCVAHRRRWLEVDGQMDTWGDRGDRVP